MFRIKDLKRISPSVDFLFSISYETKDGDVIKIQKGDFNELEKAEFHEVSKIVLTDNYIDGYPVIWFIVKQEPEFIHEDTSLMQVVSVDAFVEALHTYDGHTSNIFCDRKDPTDAIIREFTIIPDPDMKEPPDIDIKTADALIQFETNILGGN